jgi:hypothetical protein
MLAILRPLTFLLAIAIAPSIVVGQDYDTEPEVADMVEASPRDGWRSLPVAGSDTDGEDPWWSQVLLWVPNRVLDFVDIFKFDLGAGPAAGAVLRITEYGQVGYRQMLPASVRVGILGRRFPAMVEHSNELGIGPAFLESQQRRVCPGEVGVGADLFLIGAYGGICVDELFDFLAGIFFLDVKDDDF